MIRCDSIVGTEVINMNHSLRYNKVLFQKHVYYDLKLKINLYYLAHYMSFSGQNFPLSVIFHKLLTFSSPTRSLAQFQWHLAQIFFQWRENEEPQILERNTKNTWTFHLISSSRTTGPISIKLKKFVQMSSHTLFQGDTLTNFRNLFPCKQSIFISRVILSLKGNNDNIRNFSVQCCPMAS